MSACNHKTLESCLRADECAECLREKAQAHSLHRDGSAVGTMTIEELEAYAWCLKRNWPSQSARRARILANYIKRTNPPPNDKLHRLVSTSGLLRSENKSENSACSVTG